MNNKKIGLWRTLSKLYIDTDLVDSELLLIIKEFKRSGISIERIRETEISEITPVLKFNINTVIGVFPKFNEEWLISEVTKFIDSKKFKEYSQISSFRRKRLSKYTEHYWTRIHDLMRK